MTPAFQVRALRPGDDALVAAAADLFDAAPLEDATARFLAEPGHHLLMAFEGDEPAGFVTGVEMTHPDKGTEMFLYELGVRDASQGRGMATALVEALAELARERGCHGMWVLTDADNEAAVRTYRRAGGSEPSEHVLIEWRFDASVSER